MSQEVAQENKEKKEGNEERERERERKRRDKVMFTLHLLWVSYNISLHS